MSRQNFTDFSTGVFVQLLVAAKDYNRNIDGAKNGKLMRFFEKTTFALEKRPVGSRD